jgi:agmatine deiminase
MNRRRFLHVLGTTSLLGALPARAQKIGQKIGANQTPMYRLPDEGEPHAATWMAYGATASAWGTTGSYGASRVPARRDLMRIAVNLSRFEAVKMLVSKADLVQAQQFLSAAKQEAQKPGSVFSGGQVLPAIEAGGKITLIARDVNDLWVRDSGPVFVWDAQQNLAAVNLNFNGWGQENTDAPGWARDPEKARNGVQFQDVSQDRKVASFIINQTGVPSVKTWLVMEGGGLEVDGHGTAICTESCILNRNRNPGKSKQDVERELNRIMGIRKVIWLPGVKAQEITDGHIDFYARFVGQGRVVYGLDTDPQSSEYAITHQHETILSRATDADGKKLEIIPLVAPDAVRVKQGVVKRNGWNAKLFNTESFAAGYVGFYLANDCLLMAQFADPEADQNAFEVLQSLYPDRVVMQVSTDGLANGGGTIHCATQQQPG